MRDETTDIIASLTRMLEGSLEAESELKLELESTIKSHFSEINNLRTQLEHSTILLEEERTESFHAKCGMEHKIKELQTEICTLKNQINEL